MQSHAKQIEKALSNNKAAEHAVVASWQRSKAMHQLQPEYTRPPERLTEHELQQTCDKMGSLIHTAQSSLDSLYQAVGNIGCCVLLAEKNGIPIARRGAPTDDDIFNKWGLWTGAIWSENSEGTNGIGTCIIEERALTIHKNEHFHSKNTGLSCSAAPIFDHEGQLIAVIDVSSCRADLTAEFAKLISVAVVDAARRIEAGFFRYNFSKSTVHFAQHPTNQESQSPSHQGTALLAVDDNDLVIGATRRARRIYGLNDDDLKRPLPLSLLNGQDVDEARALAKAEQKVVQQALARSGGNITKAATALGINRATLHRKLKRFDFPL